MAPFCERLSTAALALVFIATAALGDVDLDEQIILAERLNVTAPWEESQAVIDALAPLLADASTDQRGRVRFLEARNLALAGDYEAAARVSADLHDAPFDAEIRLKAQRLSANIELQRDRFEAAYGHLREALKLLPDVEAAEPRTNLLALAAYFFSAAGDTDRGIAYGRQALDAAATADSARALCIATHDLAVAFQDAGRPEALDTRREALAACIDAGDPVHVAMSKISLGYLLHEESGADEALALVQVGLQEAEASGYRDGVVLGRIRVAQLLVANDRHEDAEVILRPMLDELSRLEFWLNLERAHSLLAEIEVNRGQHAVAIGHIRGAQDADRRRLDGERAIRVAYLQAEFDIRNKEQQIALLRERNAVLQLQDEADRQGQLLALGGTTAMAIISVLLLWLLVRGRAARRRLLWLSTHDGLTGLLNHSEFFRKAEASLARCTVGGQPFTLVLADIDHFKAVNDRHGHPTGDAVLRSVARCLEQELAASGIIGRVGGEEFGIAFPGSRRDGAVALVERAKERLRGAAESSPEPTVTLSFGVAPAMPGETLQLMRGRADAALYEAKRQGRDRVIDAPERQEFDDGLAPMES
ncbi:MAG: GGDEF domain-containing protein [Pseudomonadota bacterium]